MTWSAASLISSSPSVATAITVPDARLDFLQVRQRLLVAHAWIRVVHVVGGEHDHGQVLIDQRVGAVLHLAGGIAFGVDVGNFLELERAFERDRDSECRGRERGSRGAGRNCLASSSHVVVVREDRVRACRGSASAHRCRALDCSSACITPRTWPRYSANRNSAVSCAGESLGGGDADLRAGMGIDRCRRLRA